MTQNLSEVRAGQFCKEFIETNGSRRFVFGRNEFARSIAQCANVTGFIDDFTSDSEYLGRKVVRLRDVPLNSMVVSAVVYGRPLTAARRLEKQGLRHLDYFAFCKYSGLNLLPARFGQAFETDYRVNGSEYAEIYQLLSDDESRSTFTRIVDFRLSNDLAHMATFTCRQEMQYFEPFLGLRSSNEAFVDVGAYRGETSEEFIKRCPKYSAVHVFEPEVDNMRHAKSRLSEFGNISYYQMGLSSKRATLAFESGGSASKISETGGVKVEVDTLDDVVREPISFIKMDIEGGEGDAIAGARETICAFRPKMAICVYHKVDDFWKIPRQVLEICPDFKVYLRHYTEGTDETVMFFVPT